MRVGDIVEYINKTDKEGKPRDKKYLYEGVCRMKDPTTRKWVDAAIYSCVENGKVNQFVRELSDFKKHFKVYSKNESKD